jgi:hypothetical protein
MDTFFGQGSGYVVLGGKRVGSAESKFGAPCNYGFSQDGGFFGNMKACAQRQTFERFLFSESVFDLTKDWHVRRGPLNLEFALWRQGFVFNLELFHISHSCFYWFKKALIKRFQLKNLVKGLVGNRLLSSEANSK